MTVLFENVQFLSGASGATTKRTPAQRWADIFNVKDFGALGDGSHDDTAAIQLAITSASNNGIIFFPKGTYKTTAPILVPVLSSLIITGVGSGSNIVGNFNGFIFDNLSNPYGAGNGVSIIENLSLQNAYAGNTFAVTANGTWSSSGSPVSITLSGSNPGVAAGGALFINDSRFSTNSVFVGMITSVASWPTVTVSTAAVASGATSNLTMQVVQCYAANGAWSNGASTITMATTPPAGISGQYYIYDYEDILADRKTNFNRGVATWSGTTLTFTAGAPVTGASIGSSDRLWLAPVAGCVRYSSVVGATVRDCSISGFIGVTSSQDKIIDNAGAEEGFEITVERCNFSNPTGCAAVTGQTGINIQNNSLAYYNSFNSMWCSIRLSGTAISVIGGRMEVGYFGIIVHGDFTGTINSGAEIVIATLSMESNLLGLYVENGFLNINSVGVICNAVNPIAGMWFNTIAGVIQNSAAQGNFGTGYGIFIADPGNARQNTAFIASSAVNNITPSQSWRIPTQAWWGTCTQCDNPALVYTFANLTGVSTNPAAVEGDEFNISDGTNGLTWGQTATNTGTHTTHYKVRFNGTNWTVMGA